MSTGKQQSFINTISTDAIRANIAFNWLLLLRWGELVCQTLLVIVVYLVFQTKPPLPILIAIITFEGISNIAFHYLFQKRNRAVPGWLFVLVMFSDIVLLTALLHYTGGPMNPFTFLFLLHICLGAILMRPGWAWGLTGFTVLCYAGLFPLQNYLGGAAGASRHTILPGVGPAGDGVNLHLRGMWLAFSITAFFVVFLFNKIQKDLEDYQQTVAELEREKNRNEKLAALATLAAGAAHEFSTPMATIAVAAGEMLDTLRLNASDPELISDAQLIRGQVDRCRDILYRMTADAGEHLAEPLKTFTVAELMPEIVSLFPEKTQELILVACKARELTVSMPFRTVKRVIRCLIKNGLESSEADIPVQVRCGRDEHFLYFEIEDQGEGMDEDTLSRAIEPFFTTKEPGKGLGLGLYLAESAARRFGGSLQLFSRPGKGTKTVISFALDQIHKN